MDDNVLHSVEDGEDLIEVPPQKRRFCPHCLEYVGFSTYYRHRDRFFDVATNQWILSPSVVKLRTSTISTSTFSAAKQAEESANTCEFEETTVYNESYSAYSQESGQRANEGGSLMHCNATEYAADLSKIKEAYRSI